MPRTGAASLREFSGRRGGVPQVLERQTHGTVAADLTRNLQARVARRTNSAACDRNLPVKILVAATMFGCDRDSIDAVVTSIVMVLRRGHAWRRRSNSNCGDEK